jgi:hypothetical protein
MYTCRALDSGCAITGDARSPMPIAVMTTFRLVFILDSDQFSSPPRWGFSACLVPHKAAAAHEFVREISCLRGFDAGFGHFSARFFCASTIDEMRRAIPLCI